MIYYEDFEVLWEKGFKKDFTKLKLSRDDFNQIKDKLIQLSKKPMQHKLKNTKFPIHYLKIKIKDIQYRIFLFINSQNLTINVIAIEKRNQDNPYKKEKIKQYEKRAFNISQESKSKSKK